MCARILVFVWSVAGLQPQHQPQQAVRRQASVLRAAPTLERVASVSVKVIDETSSSQSSVVGVVDEAPMKKRSLKRRRPRAESMPLVASSSSSKRKTASSSAEKSNSKRRLLSKEDEIELAGRVQRLVRFEGVRRELNETLGRSPTESEWSVACGFDGQDLGAFDEAKLDAKRAKATFVSANLPLVVAVAKRYRTEFGSLDYNDLLQEGTFGLTRAVERFDADLGYRFSTYAVWWIRQAISAAVVDQSRVIRLPPKLHRDLLNLEKAAREFELAAGREPTDAELAEVLDLCATKVVFLRDCGRTTASPVVSFECPRGKKRGSHGASGSRNDLVLGDLLADQNTNPFEFAQSKEVRSHIAQLFQAALNQRECRVLSLSFGLADGRPRSLDQIATVMDTSSSTVRAIKAKALHKLRQPHSGNHILKAHYQHY